jgi:ferric-dicitrate binding protein FerR (iron transport regulator)
MGFFKAMWHTQGTPAWDRLSPGPITGINPQPDIQSKRWIHPIIRKFMACGTAAAVAGSLSVPIVAEGSRFMTAIDQGFNCKLSDGQSLQLSIANDVNLSTAPVNVFLFLRVLISRVA